MLTSKGAAGITGAGFITLAATLSVGRPRAGRRLARPQSRPRNSTERVGVGLIEYRRGLLTVLNRRGLEAMACPCYAADLRSYSDRLE